MTGYDPTPRESQWTFTARDLVAVAFRHKRVMSICLPGIFLGATLMGVLFPTYQAETKILLNRQRVDPVVSSEEKTSALAPQVTEEELNSEVELLRSDDVLRKVVMECGLYLERPSLRTSIFGHTPEEQRIASAVRGLGRELIIEPIKKTNIISVQYRSKDPNLAAQVLRSLNTAYMDKHLQVRRPSGEYEFFEKEAQRYKEALEKAEIDLKQFPLEAGASPQLARDITLQKLNEFNATLEQTRAQIAETDNRIRTLEQQRSVTPSSLTTSVRKDIGQLVTLKNNLLTLELKRTELLTKFQPSYRLVQEVDKQIADIHSEIEAVEKGPLLEETTGRDPTYSWIAGELAKAKADLSGLQARATATERIVNVYQANARHLEQMGVVQQGLLRTAKTAEENYHLYQQKREEARIADALDKTRILNVAIAQEPTVPVLPFRSPLLFALVGAVVGVVVSVSIVFALDYFDESFRTPAELENILNIPVLASVPSNATGRNGHNGHNGFGRRNGTNGNAVPSGVPESSQAGDQKSTVI